MPISIDPAAVGRVLAGGMSALATMIAAIVATAYTMSRHGRYRR